MNAQKVLLKNYKQNIGSDSSVIRALEGSDSSAMYT